jgi:drug/metabolite transporter (DMT)-like permease
VAFLKTKQSVASPAAHLTGVLLVLSGAVLWGVSGNVAQYLFHRFEVDPGWMTSVRMLSAGALLLLVSGVADRNPDVFRIWWDKSSRDGLFIFGIFGMIGAQYTYFEAVAAGNAATATLLQYLNPALIIIYLLIRGRRRPSRKELSAILLALAGVFLIVTKGHPDQLSIAPAALFWGILSAFGGAIYSMQPAGLLKKWGAAVVVGWGMMIGGVIMGLFYPPWITAVRWTPVALFCLSFVILFGTFAAFYLYVASLRFLKPIETSLLGCAEPLSSAIVSVLWLSVPFTGFDWLGTACIISVVAVLSWSPRKHRKFMIQGRNSSH